MKIHTAEFVLSAARHDQLPRNWLPEVAFAGRSNVGKSSLLNALLQRKHLAKISSTPGKTRLLNCYLINNDFNFIDLPGYGYAKAPVAKRREWGRMVEAYVTDRATLQGIVHLVDARHRPSREDLDLIAWLLDLRIPFAMVATKSDKLSHSRLQRQIVEIKASLPNPIPYPIYPCSANTGKGIPELWRWLEGIMKPTRKSNKPRISSGSL